MTDQHLRRPGRWLRLAFASWLVGATVTGVGAQGLRPSVSLDTSRGSSPSPITRTADFVVAVVNGEPITNSEVRQRLLRVEQQLAQRGGSLPAREELVGEVLELLIVERAQIQLATESGLRVDEPTLDLAEQNVAAQNQLSLDEFRRRVAAEGIDRNVLRSELRNQILLQRVREREVESRVRVSEADISAFLSEQSGSTQDPSRFALDLSHVLIRVPEGTGEAQLAALQAKARSVAERARAGTDFATLAAENSDAPERTQGGAFGMRRADRLPELFVNAVRDLPVGGIAGPLRSEAGFHVLRLNARDQASQPWASVVETRVSHILLRPSPSLSQAQASERLAGWRAEVMAGRSAFDALARQHSQDGSAKEGGSLGWSTPGMFVPEFESVMDRLAPGQVSSPVISRFGVHLIRVDERRERPLSPEAQREAVRALVKERKTTEALRAWLQEVRERAFVEQRDPPRL